MKTHVFPDRYKELAEDIPDCPELSEGEPVASADPVIKNESNTLIWYSIREDNTRIIQKMYHHRGFFNLLRQKIFYFRAQREYNALSFLIKNGIPCSEPLFWAYGYKKPWGVYEIVATRELPDAVSIPRLSEAIGREEDIDLFPLFDIIRAMHKAGFHHGALYPRNILIRGKEDKDRQFYMIDTPKSVIFSGDVSGTRMAWFDLLDLCRELRLYINPDLLPSLLNHYGLDDRRISRLLETIPVYNTRKKIRKVIRGEFLVRSLFQSFETAG